MSNGSTFNHALSLDLADECMKCIHSGGCANAKNNAMKEVLLRCVINRAYYSVWPRVKKIAERKWPKYDDDLEKAKQHNDKLEKLKKRFGCKEGAHFDAWLKWVLLCNIDYNNIETIKSLMYWRSRVDYDRFEYNMNYIVNKTNTMRVIEDAKVISKLLLH